MSSSGEFGTACGVMKIKASTNRWLSISRVNVVGSQLAGVSGALPRDQIEGPLATAA